MVFPPEGLNHQIQPTVLAADSISSLGVLESTGLGLLGEHG